MTAPITDDFLDYEDDEDLDEPTWVEDGACCPRHAGGEW